MRYALMLSVIFLVACQKDDSMIEELVEKAIEKKLEQIIELEDGSFADMIDLTPDSKEV